MKQQSINLLIIVVLISIPNPFMTAKADETKADEITLRNQLFADVFLLKEGVDRLQISVEILNKRYTNQIEILKSIQTKLWDGADELKGVSESEVCYEITALFNATFRKYNAFESRVLNKLEEVQEEQTTRLDEILAKQQLKKNCIGRGEPSSVLGDMSSVLSDVSVKVDKFEEKLLKLEMLEHTFNLQQIKFDTFVESQMKLLQQISEKLSKNQNILELYEKEFPSLKDLKNNLNKAVPKTRPKLPMEVILGLTSSNITGLK